MRNKKQLARSITRMALIVCILGLVACNDQPTTANAEQQETAIQQPDAGNVNSPERVVAGADGSLLLTAENGLGVGPEIKYMPEWRAFGWFTAADRVEWEVEVPKAGEYEVQLEWSVSDEEAGREFLLEAGDQQLTGVVAKSGSWETFTTANIGRLSLKDGLQTFVFKPNKAFGGGALLDLRSLRLLPMD